jgi:hypothetical protein
MSELPLSDELTDLVFTALDHAVGSVAEGGPLIPFAVTEGAEGRKLARFVAERLEDAQAQARLALKADADASRVALAYDGYLTVEGERTDAVFVEAQERGQDAVAFAQRYGAGGRFRKFATIGNAAFLGPADPLL